MAVCSRDLPRVMCDARRTAMQAGEMIFHPDWLCWVYPVPSPTPRPMSIDEVRRPFGLEWCPFCFGDLPTAADAVNRALEPPPSAPWNDQADGGEGPE